MRVDSAVGRDADVRRDSVAPATLAEMSRAKTVNEMVGLGFFPEEVGLGPAEALCGVLAPSGRA